MADPDYNADRIIESIKAAQEKGVKVLVFPELTLTGCTCYDLVMHRTLLDGAKKALIRVIKATEGVDMGSLYHTLAAGVNFSLTFFAKNIEYLRK